LKGFCIDDSKILTDSSFGSPFGNALFPGAYQLLFTPHADAGSSAACKPHLFFRRYTFQPFDRKRPPEFAARAERAAAAESGLFQSSINSFFENLNLSRRLAPRSSVTRERRALGVASAVKPINEARTSESMRRSLAHQIRRLQQSVGADGRFFAASSTNRS